MEQPLITAVTHSTSEARVTLVGVPDEPGAAARIFEALAEANVNVDMIVRTSRPRRAGARRSPSRFRARICATRATALQPLAGGSFVDLSAHEEMGKVSIVGAGMRSHPASPRRCSGCSPTRA